MKEKTRMIKETVPMIMETVPMIMTEKTLKKTVNVKKLNVVKFDNYRNIA